MKTFEQLKEDFGIVQCKSEFEELTEIVKSINPKLILEIGAERGGSFQRWVDLLNDGVAVCIDTDDKIIWDKFDKGGNMVFHLKGKSQDEKTLDIFNSFINTLPPQYDFDKISFLYIDGDHSYDGVKRDFINYSKYLRKGGIISFHDINSGDGMVTSFWNEIKNHYPHKELNGKENPIGTGVLFLK